MRSTKLINESEKTLDSLIENCQKLSNLDSKKINLDGLQNLEKKQKDLLYQLLTISKSLEKKSSVLHSYQKSLKSVKKSFSTSYKPRLQKKSPRTNRPKKKVL